MMGSPRLLMLDGTLAGLAPKMVDELLGICAAHCQYRHHRADGGAERRKALAVADRGYVLERGQLVASGPKLLAGRPVVRGAYLGRQQRNHRGRAALSVARSHALS